MSTILLDIDDQHIARITLNRPQVHNAFDDEVIEAFIDALHAVQDDHRVRLLVICGKGNSFCAGADLLWMQRSVEYSEAENLVDARKLALLMHMLDVLPVPTVVYMHGAVFGGGVGLAACCDIALADYGTRFALSEVKLGLVPAVISPYVVRTIGARQARRYFLTGEKFDASTAHRLGLVHELVDHGEAESRLNSVIQDLLASGPHALKRTKKLIRDVDRDVLESTRRMTTELIADIRMSEEAQTGMAAFLKREAPAWSSKRGRNV